MIGMAIQNNDGDLIDVLLSSNNQFLESELRKVDPENGRSMMN
jgi:hypothetical protein